MKSFVLSLLLSLTAIAAQGQSGEDIWFFGGRFNSCTAGLRFNSVAGTVSDYSGVRFPLDLQENNITVTNPQTGEVIFYSDGNRVVDQSNNVMPGGENLAGSPSTMYGTAVVRDPANCDRYLLIYGEDENDNPPRKIFYSTIDLSLAGNGTMVAPMGEVVADGRNRQITSNLVNATEGLFTLAKNDGSYDSWLFIGDNSNKELQLYEISPTGITLRQSLPFATMFPDNFRNTTEIFGIRLAFHEGVDGVGKLVVAISRSYNKLDTPIGFLEFDRRTGVFSATESTLITNSGTDWTYGLAFSASGDLLYFSDYFAQTLRQYDFRTGVPRQIGRSPHNGRTGGLKMGPDGRIYWANRFNNAGGGADIYPCPDKQSRRGWKRF